MKFFKSKSVKGVYTAKDSDGNNRFVFGTISDLINANLIISDHSPDLMKEYNDTHWMCIDRNGHTNEFDSKDEVKHAIILLETVVNMGDV